MEEDSTEYFDPYREPTFEELFKRGQYSRIHKSNDRFEHCRKSFLWLKNALGLGASFGLENMLRQIEAEGSAMFYCPPRFIKKPEGGTRIIISPNQDLQLVQKRIHLLLRKTFERPLHTFGFRGGSCMDVALRHRDSLSTFKFDVKDAFFKVGYYRVRNAIRGFKSNDEILALPGFSSAVAHWTARLCTYTPVSEEIIRHLSYKVYSFLPQGAPTSPICFDLACAGLDKKLLRIAERVGGIVSRYADNYYFSMPTSRISPELEAMIICSTHRRYGFPIHKVRKVDEGELCRILGYNLEDGKIRNTREFLRKLRGALYVLKTKLERGLEWEDAYQRVRGFMGFASNLPANLLQTYEYCESKIAVL